MNKAGHKNRHATTEAARVEQFLIDNDNNGAARVPVNLKAANIPNIKGDSVCSSTNQDRIIISMNSAQFNVTSADHINRKPETENEEKVLLATSLIKKIS